MNGKSETFKERILFNNQFIAQEGDNIPEIMQKFLDKPESSSLDELYMLADRVTYYQEREENEQYVDENYQVNLLQWLCVYAYDEHVELLFKKIPQTSQKLLAEKEWDAVQICALNGRVTLLDLMIKEVPNLLLIMMKENAWYGFRGAVGGNHLHVFQWMEKNLPEDSQQLTIETMIKSDNHRAIKLALIYNSLPVLQWMAEKTSGSLQETVLAACFKCAVELQQLPSVQHVTELLQKKYPGELQRIIYPACKFVINEQNLPILDFLSQKNRNAPGSTKLLTNDLIKEISKQRFMSAMACHYLLNSFYEPIARHILELADIHPFYVPVKLIMDASPVPLMMHHIEAEKKYLNDLGPHAKNRDSCIVNLSFFAKTLRHHEHSDSLNQKDVQDYFREFILDSVDTTGGVVPGYLTLSGCTTLIQRILHIFDIYCRELELPGFDEPEQLEVCSVSIDETDETDETDDSYSTFF